MGKERFIKLLESFWGISFLLTGLCSGAYFFMMAGGFPTSSLLFWSNTIMSPVITVLILLSLIFRSKQKAKAYRTCKISYIAFIGSFIITAKILYPQTVRVSFLVFFAVFIGVLLLSLLQEKVSAKHIYVIPACALSISIGFILPLSQKTEAASTIPLNEPLSQFTTPLKKVSEAVSLREGASVYLNNAAFRVRSGKSTLHIHPLLRFISLSPDKC